MIALDTNVLIYACDRSSPERQKRAAELIDRATSGVLLWQVACEFVAASRKLADQGFTASRMPGVVSQIFKRCSLWFSRGRESFSTLASCTCLEECRSGTP